MRFPLLRGTSLSGNPVSIPDDLPDPVVVLLAFKQWQQPDIDAWIAVLEAAEVEHFIEVPLLGGKWQPFRSFIDGGMASAIRVPEVLDRTITVYGQIGEVEAALHLPTRDQVYAVVVRSGLVAIMQAGLPLAADHLIEAYRTP